jgi:hypothetical protein
MTSVRQLRLVAFSAAVAVAALALAPRARAAPGEDPPINQPQAPPWTSLTAAGGIDDYGAYASLAYRSFICGLYQVCSWVYVSHQRKNVGGLALSVSADHGATFSTSIIDPGSGGDLVGAHTDVVAKPLGGVFISYQNQTDDRLMVARLVGGTQGNCGGGAWRCKNVGSGGRSSSISLDSDDRVSVIHISSSGLKHSFADPPYDTYTTETVSTKAITSADSAVDNLDQLHVAFTTGQCLYYRYWFGSGWSDLETVDCAPSNPTLDAGRVSLVVNWSQRPHIAFITNTASGGYQVKHAYKVDYQTWAVEHVSFVSTPQAGTSIALDSDNANAIAITYGTTTSTGPKLVWAYPGWLFGWDGAVIDQPGGGWSSMKWIAGKLGVAHYDPIDKNLRFTKHD